MTRARLLCTLCLPQKGKVDPHLIGSQLWRDEKMPVVVQLHYFNCDFVPSSRRSAQPAIDKRRAVHRLPRHHHCPLDVGGRVQRHLL